ncbi:MAG TPA: DUF4229 domain-containing protein [Acidothermaceae bacterium]
MTEDAGKPARSHPFIRYTSARIALFVIAVVVVWLVRLASGVLLVIVALLISGLASFALLGRQRAEVSAALFERRERQRAHRWAAYNDDDENSDENGESNHEQDGLQALQSGYPESDRARTERPS